MNPENIEQVVKIPTELIDIGDNIRDYLTDNSDEIYDLAESIKAVGQLQPCIVYKNGDRYILKYGSRRFKACLKAEIPTVNCIISTEFKDEKERILTQAIENEHRKDMTDRERESYICELRKLGMSLDEIANGLKKSKGWISKSLKAHELREKNADILKYFKGEVDTATMYQFKNLSNDNLTKIIADAKKEGNSSEILGIKIRKEIKNKKQVNDKIFDTLSQIEKKITKINYTIVIEDKNVKINSEPSNNSELDKLLLEKIKAYYQNKGFSLS